jgi:hypothetical protein
MLYKNEELYSLAPNDLKTLYDKFKRFPLKIVYPEGRVKKSRTLQNKLPDKPSSMSFPLRAVVNTSTGSEVWRYADNVIIKEHGVKKFIPKNLRFNGALVLEEKDKELAWFLYTKSPFCQNGKAPGKTHKFMFEDLISEAEKRADAESLRSQASALIFGKDIGLPEERLRAIAKSYFVKNVDQLTFPQVKIALDHVIKRNGDKGYEHFIDISGSADYLKIRVKIQNLIDAGRIKFDGSKKEWQWVEAGKKVEGICKVTPGSDVHQILLDYYNGNKNFQEMVDLVGKARKTKVAISEDVET